MDMLVIDHRLDKEMETHSNILAWEISWTEEPGGQTAQAVAKIQTQLSSWVCMYTVM